MTLKVFEAFAGIGTQRMALRNLGIAHEVVAISEINKYALKSYEAIHGEVNNLGDITKIKIDDIPECDLFTYSFPCQDISVAGLGNGLAEGTRSSLLWECERIISAKKPQYLLMEKEMIKVDVIDFFLEEIRVIEESGQVFSMGFKYVELMQSTELKDKNGKEIYEGDIIEYIDGEYSFVGVVENSIFGLYARDDKDNYKFEDFADENTMTAEVKVIGNIYENPELLEGKNE